MRLRGDRRRAIVEQRDQGCLKVSADFGGVALQIGARPIGARMNNPTEDIFSAAGFGAVEGNPAEHGMVAEAQSGEGQKSRRGEGKQAGPARRSSRGLGFGGEGRRDWLQETHGLLGGRGDNDGAERPARRAVGAIKPMDAAIAPNPDDLGAAMDSQALRQAAGRALMPGAAT